jgi:hypothetical protein
VFGSKSPPGTLNLAQLRGYYVRAAADGIFNVEEKLTGRYVGHGTVAQVRRWLPGGQPISGASGACVCRRLQNFRTTLT